MSGEEGGGAASATEGTTADVALAPPLAPATTADSTFVREDGHDSDEDAPLLLGGDGARDESDRSRSRVAALRRKLHGTSGLQRPPGLAPDSALPRPSRTWTPRSALLSLSLSLTLCSFWLLDSLKDPVFAALVGGDLRTHQPRAKLVSVAGQVGLVWLMETVLNERRRRQRNRRRRGGGDVVRNMHDAEVQDGGGRWTRMAMGRGGRKGGGEDDDSGSTAERIPVSVFRSIGVPYSLAFVLGAWMLRKHPSFSFMSSAIASPDDGDYAWRVLGYVLYLSIESYGSLSVAAFWSYANSTLSLSAAEAWYGTIVACAQLGAIGGSTLAAKYAHGGGLGGDDGTGEGGLAGVPRLFLLSVGGMGLQMAVISIYGHFFPHPMAQEDDGFSGDGGCLTGSSSAGRMMRKTVSFHETVKGGNAGSSSTGKPPSALNLILRHNYLLLILGVSCLYEVSLTCLDYQLKLIGLDRFGGEDAVGVVDAAGGGSGGGGTATPVGAAWALAATFSQFMGRFGQLTNALSLLLSYLAFPWLMSRYGLRRTILLFPTLLVVVTIVTYLAVPLNLPVLFVSMSLLKAMTYSLNDPAKEILYIPTSDDVKFRCKFWIDVVGARVAKAAGSSLNTYAGSAERIVRYGTVPSVATAAGLWLVCRAAGREFDRLLSTGEVVGAGDGAGKGEIVVDLTVDGADLAHFDLVGSGEVDGAGGLPIDEEEIDGDLI